VPRIAAAKSVPPGKPASGRRVCAITLELCFPLESGERQRIQRQRNQSLALTKLSNHHLNLVHLPTKIVLDGLRLTGLHPPLDQDPLI